MGAAVDDDQLGGFGVGEELDLLLGVGDAVDDVVGALVF